MLFDMHQDQTLELQEDWNSMLILIVLYGTGKKAIKRIIILIVIALLVICYIKRYKAVNQELHSAPVREYTMGTEVKMGRDILLNYTMQGYSIKVNNAEILTYKKFLKKYTNY